MSGDVESAPARAARELAESALACMSGGEPPDWVPCTMESGGSRLPGYWTQFDDMSFMAVLMSSYTSSYTYNTTYSYRVVYEDANAVRWLDQPLAEDLGRALHNAAQASHERKVGPAVQPAIDRFRGRARPAAGLDI